MGEQYSCQPFVVFRLVFRQPENFRGGKPCGNRVADTPDYPPGPAGPLCYDVSLGGSGSIAPQLGRADDPAVPVQRDEAMLLPRDPYGSDVTRVNPGFPGYLCYNPLTGIYPPGGMLLAGTAVILDEVMVAVGPGENFPRGSVKQDRFCPLRTRINTQIELSAGHSPPPHSFKGCS
jgi:hypothetical protein